MGETVILKTNGLVSVEWSIVNYRLRTNWHRTCGEIVRSPSFEMEGEMWSLQLCHIYSLKGTEARIALLKDSPGSKKIRSFTYQLLVQINEDEICKGCTKTYPNSEEQLADLCMGIGLQELLSLMVSDDLKVLCNFYVEVENETSPRTTNEGIDVLASHMKNLFLKGENCDFVIKVKPRIFKVHKAILSARSPVLSAMLHHDMAEKNSGFAIIQDCDPDVFESFLLYLYSGQVERVSWENVTHLFTLGDKYDMPDLTKECLQFMEDNMTVDGFCDAIELAMKHNEFVLLKSAEVFFLKNVDSILGTNQWLLLMSKNPVICNELFKKYAANSLLL